MKKLVFLFFLCALNILPSSASTSLFNAQTTEILPKGKYELKIKADKKASEKQFHAFSSYKFAFSENFEVGANAQLTGSKDTILYGKWRIFNGDKTLPSFAAGVSRIKVNAPSSFYLAATKPFGSFKFSVEADIAPNPNNNCINLQFMYKR